MKKNGIVVFLSLIFICCLFLVFLWGVYLPKDYRAQQEVIFSIKRGEGTQQIAAQLQKDGVIKSQIIFLLYAFGTSRAKTIQAGDYALSPSLSMSQILVKLNRGDVMKEKFTIIEGWSIADIGLSLEQKKIISKKSFEEMAQKDWSAKFDFLKDKPTTASLEGYLFPDTYEFQGTENAQDVLLKALSNFDKKLTPSLREQIANQHKSIFQIITMASLVEKEVKTSEDKRIVAGILWKRINHGMPLQVDATIVYITGSRMPQSLAQGEKIDSLYNTYKYKGLPVGPISNSGIESIVAAVSPQQSDYWYYLSTSEGKTIFSKTFQEHTAAIAKYLR